jgi:hypothetical protein
MTLMWMFTLEGVIATLYPFEYDAHVKDFKCAIEAA